MQDQISCHGTSISIALKKLEFKVRLISAYICKQRQGCR